MLGQLSRTLIVFTFLTAGVGAPLACDLCAIYGAAEAQGESGKGFFGGVAEQYTYFGTFQSGGHNATNPDGEYLNSLVSQAFVGYNISERFGVQFNLPVIYRDYGKNGAHGSEGGIGDVSLVGNVRLYEKLLDEFTFRWTALGASRSRRETRTSSTRRRRILPTALAATTWHWDRAHSTGWSARVSTLAGSACS